MCVVNGRWKEGNVFYCFKEVEMVLAYSMGRDYYRCPPLF